MTDGRLEIRCFGPLLTAGVPCWRWGGLFGTFAVVTVSVWWANPHLFDPVWVQSRIEAVGPTVPVVFVLLQATQVVLAPVPGQFLAGVGRR